MITRRKLATAVVLLLLAKNRTHVMRSLIQLLFKARLALHRLGVWPVKPTDVFQRIDHEEPPSPELLSFCHLVDLLMIKQRWTPRLAVWGLKLFDELGLFWNWRGLPAHDVETVNVGSTQVPCHFVRSSKVPVRDDAVIMYVHGGGYVAGTFQSYKPFVARLSERCKCTVMFVDYSLVPLKKVEDAQEEIMEAYIHLVDVLGFDASKVVISGDSAGGGHSLGVLQKIAHRGLPRPAAGALISPSTDMTLTSRSFHENDKDTFFSQKDLMTSIQHVVLNKSKRMKEPHSPEVSFGFGAYENLAPLFVCVGEGERLHNDTVLLCDRAEKAGIEVDLDLQPYGVHDFPLLNFNVPEFHAGFDRLASFIESKLE